MRKIKISRAACLAMIASAAEVFPKECMGVVCSMSKLKGYTARIQSAFPYQKAKRGNAIVSSDSSYWLLGMMTRNGPFRLGEYHSHPYQSSDRLEPLEPSEYDLENMEVGAMEIILRVHRVLRRHNFWKSTTAGNISVGWGRFRFRIKAFVRTEGFDKNQVPNYKTVKMEMIK